jgi:hypothetical protein
MAWGMDPLDLDKTRYKDFISILMTYTFQPSSTSLPYIFVYTIVMLIFGY